MATQTRKKTAGRPLGSAPKMTDAVVKAFLDAMRVGNPIKTSANFAGVSQQVVMRWIENGREFENIPASQRTAVQEKYADFVQQCDKAQGAFLARAQSTLFGFLVLDEDATREEKKLAADTAKFLLTHRDPANYSPRAQTEITGKDGGPVDLTLDVESIFEIMVDGKERGLLDE